MTDRLEVYIRNENVVLSTGIIRPVADHSCSDGMTGKTERIMSENDRSALKIAEEFADENGLSVEIYDVRSIKGKMKARLRHVETTPTIIIGNSRVEGEFTPEELKNKLQSCVRVP